MQVVDEATHRTLGFIEAMNRAGVNPLVGHVNAFGKRPDWDVRRYRLGAALRALGEMAADPVSERANESFCDYLHRIGLVRFVDRGGVELSQSGKALLRSLNAPTLSDPTVDVVELVLDPANPFSYAMAVSALGSAGTGLLVEPYLRVPQLADVANLDNIDRVLIGPKLRTGDIAALRAALAVPDVALPELRQAKELHDRYFIPDDVSKGVLMLGVSLGGVRLNHSVITTLGSDISSQIRTVYNELWRDANHVEPQSELTGDGGELGEPKETRSAHMRTT